MTYCPLRSAMIDLAPRVEELSGLRIPRRYGHMVHPKIKWMSDPWHDYHYGFYRPPKKMIYINAHFAANAAHPDLIRAVIAHEYVHYLQDLHWSHKDWNDEYKLEAFAYDIENYFVPPEFKIDKEVVLGKYKVEFKTRSSAVG
jgi:Zn-dependent peptidase ImmA (M78 family)